MLRDIERKVLRILYNFSAGRRRLPTFHELSVKTGRNEKEIRFILNKLKEAGFIEWDGQNISSIVIYKAWENEPTPMRNDTSIWMM